MFFVQTAELTMLLKKNCGNGKLIYPMFIHSEVAA